MGGKEEREIENEEKGGGGGGGILAYFAERRYKRGTLKIPQQTCPLARTGPCGAVLFKWPRLSCSFLDSYPSWVRKLWSFAIFKHEFTQSPAQTTF